MTEILIATVMGQAKVFDAYNPLIVFKFSRHLGIRDGKMLGKLGHNQNLSVFNCVVLQL